MTSYHNSNFYNFIKWISRMYVSLERRTIPYPCKIIGVNIKNEDIILEIQFAGLTDTIGVSANEIVNKNYFEYFSPKDKKRIFDFVYNKVRLKLSERYYCQNENKEFVIFTDLVTGHKMTCDITSIAKNNDLISMIDPLDANKIGFFAGIEYMKTITNSQV